MPDRVRELRATGYSPKQIAKTLDLRPAVAARLVRMLAAEEAAAAPEPAVVGCWVSPGWSAHLTVDGPEQWADVPPPEDGMTGLAAVAVARRHRPQRVSVCGYLVDTFCLGVKNTLGPELMHERDLPDFLHTFFTSFEAVGQPLAVPLELARHLVWGGQSTTPAAWVSNQPPTSATPQATSANGRTPAGSPSVATECRSTCPAPTTTRAPSSAPWTGRAARATTTTSSARAEDPFTPRTSAQAFCTSVRCEHDERRDIRACRGSLSMTSGPTLVPRSVAAPHSNGNGAEISCGAPYVYMMTTSGLTSLDIGGFDLDF